MFRAVHVHHVDAEQRIRQPPGSCGVREVNVDDERGDEREDDAEAEAVEADVCVGGPDDAVAVLVEEVDVLLQDGLVRVFGSPIVFECAVGHFF